MMRIDPETLSSSELHALKKEIRDIMDVQWDEYHKAQRLRASDDASGIRRHLDDLKETMDGINGELTRRREEKEAREARQNQRGNRR